MHTYILNPNRTIYKVISRLDPRRDNSGRNLVTVPALWERFAVEWQLRESAVR